MEYFNCRLCDRIYESHTANDKNSRHEINYARYLGFCSADCYDKVSNLDKDKEHFFAYLEGDIRKRNKLKYIPPK